jgi:heavy metal translocating P-type ATPase
MVAILASCALCGLPTARPLQGDDGRSFCCPACREVAGLLAAGPAPAAAAPTSIAEAASATLSLGALWCSSCAWLVGATLQRAPGVQSAEVSFVQREARVTFDPARTDPRRLTKAVRRLGYRAWLPGEKPHDEEEAHFNRLMASVVFVIEDVVISAMLYGREWLGMNTPDDAGMLRFFYAMMLLGAVPLFFLLGVPILRAGAAGLLRGRPDMHTLIALGVLAALGVSIRNLLIGAPGIYFDTASMLLFLVALGRWFDLRAQRSGSGAIERLWRRLPQEAAWITAEGERRVPPDQLPPGARVRVRPGERFPVDGLVAAGDGDVDESLLTGEPTPVTRRAGERVLAGTLNLDGAFEVITTAVGAETAAGRIGRVLHQALWERSPVERLADRLAALMVPAAALLALATLAFWTQHSGLETGLLHALAVLLIACPCALGIATPLALWAGLGRATEAGVILRSTAALERLAGVRSLFFDKTGTLTRLPIQVQAVAAEGMDEDELLARVAAVESGSEHPLAQALVAEARRRALAIPAAQAFRAWHGRGVSGEVEGGAILVGNERLIAERLGAATAGTERAEQSRPTSRSVPSETRNVTLGPALTPRLAELAEEWRDRGLVVVYVAWQGRLAGIIGLGEQLRAEAGEAIEALRGAGLALGVLTGDAPAAGARWERRLGLPVAAGLLPEEKMARLRAAEGPVAMVGDGINDGPALAAATVGVALSHGTDVARAAADIILLGDDLRTVPWLLELSRATMRTVRQNMLWAFVYNIVGIGLAMTGQLQPVLAAAAMVVSSLLVTGNALRLRQAAPAPRETWQGEAVSNITA